ncbi:MAG: hypothetical protein ABI629_16865 [bacterium]
MTELYWMALLRDVPIDQFDTDAKVATAATEIDKCFKQAVADTGDAGHLMTGMTCPARAARRRLSLRTTSSGSVCRTRTSDRLSVSSSCAASISARSASISGSARI